MKTVNHPFTSHNVCVKRLYDEYEKYGNLAIGFDFDNTIFDLHDNGGDYTGVISLLRECKELGLTMCLYTAESSAERLEWKKQYCKYKGFEADYVNESPLLPGTTKPFFSILLDDRAGLESAYYILRNTIDEIKNGAGTKSSASRGE